MYAKVKEQVRDHLTKKICKDVATQIIDLAFHHEDNIEFALKFAKEVGKEEYIMIRDKTPGAKCYSARLTKRGSLDIRGHTEIKLYWERRPRIAGFRVDNILDYIVKQIKIWDEIQRAEKNGSELCYLRPEAIKMQTEGIEATYS